MPPEQSIKVCIIGSNYAHSTCQSSAEEVDRLNAIEMQLEKPGGLATVLQLVAAFTYPERVRVLGWMVHHAAENAKKADIYKGLIVALHEALPATIPAEELRCLVDSMRGHMRQLTWAEPWLFQDVVLPLLQNDCANTDDACNIWVSGAGCFAGAGTETPAAAV